MGDEAVHASAVVTIEIRIPVKDSWGPGTSIDQVFAQAVESARGMIRNGHLRHEGVDFEVIGIPKVTQVLVIR